MRELVVVSGKGGTGKTSVVSSFAALARNAVLADCDVDAADLHIILDPTVRESGPFSGGKRATIRGAECTGCGLCYDLCAFDAVVPARVAEARGPAAPAAEAGGPAAPATYAVDPVACEGCGVCAHFCPEGAIDFGPVENGRWFLSDTRFGPLAHARLGIAEENSGKLAALVREKAREAARGEGRDLIITDGPPGVGCPVISSITGADMILVVTEPTGSGRHDLDRVLELALHFDIPALVAVNKADLNSDITAEIARRAGEAFVGSIPYDRAVVDAQVRKRAVMEVPLLPGSGTGPAAASAAASAADTGAAGQIRRLWETVTERLSSL